MPLQHGNSRAVISQNIREMVAAGHPQNQAVAAALRIAHESGGGRVHRQMGGMSPSMESPWWERSEARTADQFHPGGLIGGVGAGRTDRIPLAVMADSHVIPADVVSGLGQGTTLGGARVLEQAMHSAPYAVSMPGRHGGSTIPRPPAVPHAGFGQQEPGFGQQEPGFAIGGQPRITHILAAPGEFIVPPHIVHAWGQGDMRRGHDRIDDMIKRVRQHTIKWMKTAPPPKK